MAAMDIGSVSMSLSQGRLQNQVGVTLLSKSLKGMEEQATDLLKILDSVSPLAEGTGTRINTFA